MGEILVVDDDEKILIATGAALRAYGYEATLSNAPQEALALLKKNPNRFDVILLDWKLRSPMDGDIVIKVIQYMFPGFKTPIIFVTAHTRISSKYLMRLGAFDTLAKPVTAEQLIDAVERALNKKSQENPHEQAPAYLSPRDLKRQHMMIKITDAIHSSNSFTEAAEQLHVSRRSLYRWLDLTGLREFYIQKEPKLK
jgi:DNA-binding NtrC family response regulator